MAERTRTEHGWVTESGYLCDGCNVREPFEHRCHGDDGGRSCECPECVVAFESRDDGAGVVAYWCPDCRPVGKGQPLGPFDGRGFVECEGCGDELVFALSTETDYG